MKKTKNKRIQFVSDTLVQQIIEGRKTASVVTLGEVDVADGDYDDPLVVGEYYDVYDSSLVVRATIRIVGMELCRWEEIPERLWRGETNTSADEFRHDHLDYFENPSPDFEFVAYYFQRTELT
ncbi:MAG: hypothetical protein HQ510_01815 [Candidatus Marinimicrobia bacterium]|nr:hypothetical protein [Candidatus Neomarinimicrobiota bacterium]